MHKILFALVIAVPALALPTLGNAKGCLKGAAVGGVAGHVAGHHGLVGAAAGCVIERHREKVRDQKASAAGKSAPTVDSNPPVMRTKNGTVAGSK